MRSLALVVVLFGWATLASAHTTPHKKETCLELAKTHKPYTDVKSFEERTIVRKGTLLRETIIYNSTKPWHTYHIPFLGPEEILLGIYLQEKHADSCIFDIEYNYDEQKIRIRFVEMPTGFSPHKK